MRHRAFAAAGSVLVAVLAGCGPGQNYPPGTPSTPNGPATGVVNVPYSFTTRAFDHENDDLRYQFYWGDGSHSDWGSLVPSGTFDSAIKSWFHTGTYAVRARARDKAGELSDSSEAHSIVIVQSLPNRSPLVPQIPNGPDTGWKDTLYKFSTAGSDPDNDSVSYRFDWGDGSTSSWTDLVPSGTPAAKQYSWTAAGTYPVRAMARDSKGLISDWSDARTVIIRESLDVHAGGRR
jgi:hypothetical protein